MYFLWITLFVFGTISAENITLKPLEINGKDERNNDINNIDLLRERLLEQQWEDDTRPCLDAMLMTLTNAKNFTLWAVWLMDSNQYPIGQLYGSQYHFGSYEQCIDAPWSSTHNELRTQYCLADITPNGANTQKTESIDPYSPAQRLFTTLTKYDRNLTSLSWGFCIPAACNNRAFLKIVRSMLQQSHLGPIADEFQISVDSCQVSGTQPEYTFGFYAFLLIIITLFITTIISTIYVNYINKCGKPSLALDIAKCFCAKKNTDELTIVRKDEISTMNIMRVVSIFYVNSFHILSAKYLSPVNDALNLDKLQEAHGAVMYHSDIVVDTFLTLSAILLMKKLMNDKVFKPLKLMWNRYIRIFGVLSMTIFYMAYIFIHTSDGPAWPKLTRDEGEFCASNGWLNLLMINNYFQVENACFTASWFLATDYQLMVLGVLLYYVYQKNKRAGVISLVIVSIFAVLIPGIVTYWMNLPPAYLEIGSLNELRKNYVFNNIYIPSHTRAAPYLVGMAGGYILSVYKPAEYRKVISTKLSVLGTLVCLVLLSSVMYYGYYVTIDHSLLEVAIFVATNRIVWSIAICAIIIFNEYGTLPIISSLFNWSPFIPLSRLTFGVYMSHVLLVFQLWFSTRTPHTSGMLPVIIVTIGITTLAFVLSYVIWLTIEAPLININNLLFGSNDQQHIYYEATIIILCKKFRKPSTIQIPETKESITNDKKHG